MTPQRRAPKTAGVYVNITEFSGKTVREEAIAAQPSFLMDKHKKFLAGENEQAHIRTAKEAGFNTLFMTIYPLWGMDWWSIPAARNLVKDAMVNGRKDFKVH